MTVQLHDQYYKTINYSHKVKLLVLASVINYAP